MRDLLLLTFACVGYACFSPPSGARSDGGLWVENAGESAVLFSIFELEQSHLVDPAPAMQVEEHPDRLLEPGQRRRVQVEGYVRGDAVRLFLYDVPAGQRTGPVQQSRMITVSHEELLRSGYLVRIPPR
ncbi:MAG TPA: hypothetical protein VHG08_15885 [Longimicrobium sp.]|nr:hypothetical protein [Longimicrobium sp.]